MRRLICAFVVRIGQKQVFSWRCSFLPKRKAKQSNRQYGNTNYEARSHNLNNVRTRAVSSRKKNTMWAASWQNQQNECAPSEGSDQSGHLPRLNRVFAVRMKKAWVLSNPVSAHRRLWSDWADTQADLSLRWTHNHFVGFVMRRLMRSKSRFFMRQTFTLRSGVVLTGNGNLKFVFFVQNIQYQIKWLSNA